MWDGSRFIWVGYEGVYTSADGLNWTKVYSVSTAPLISVAGNGEQMVAVGLGVILTSAMASPGHLAY